MNEPLLTSLADEVLFFRTATYDDKKAFAELYERYWKKLVDSCYKRLQCLATSEEIAQDIFIDFYVRRREITFNSTLEAYLLTAVKYKVFNFYRAQHSHQKYVAQTLANERICFTMPDERLHRKQVNAFISSASQHMPTQCRKVFLLSRIGHFSQKSIAQQLGISVSTVKKHITKANQILREKLGYLKADLLAWTLIPLNLEMIILFSSST